MTDLTTLDADLQKLGPLVSYPWHLQQQFALAASTDIVVVGGGTQSGKTQVGSGILSRVVRREGPIYRRLLTSGNPIDQRPMKLWVAPQTLDKFKSNWEHRLLHEVFAGMEYHYTQSPFPVIRWHDEVTTRLKLPPNELWSRSHDQGFLAFESDVVDVVLFDEEPTDKRIWTSARLRGTTVNGVVVFTYTPINGMTWTYSDFYTTTVKDGFKVADRVWKRGRALTYIQMGMADNPSAVAGGGVDRILNDPSMTEAEKRTRLYGEYGYTEGLIFPSLGGITTESEDIHLLDRVPRLKRTPEDAGQPMPLSWVLTADPNKRHGGVLVGLDPFGNHYVCDEHYADSLPDSLHAQAYKDILRRWDITEDEVLMGADPGGAGAQAILNLLDHGLAFQSVKKDAGSVAASIQMLRRLLWSDPTHAHPVTGQMGAPRLYFLRSLRSTWREDGVEHHESRLLYELRQYRQQEGKPPDTPVKERDDCVDPLRYVTLLRPYQPEIDSPEEAGRRAAKDKLDPYSRKVDDEFDRMVEQAARQKQRKRGVDYSR